MSQVPGASRTISGCIGLIHLPSSAGDMTRPLAPTSAWATAHTSIPGFSRPCSFATLTRTRTVRVRSSSTGSTKDIWPLNTSPG